LEGGFLSKGEAKSKKRQGKATPRSRKKKEGAKKESHPKRGHRRTSRVKQKPKVTETAALSLDDEGTPLLEGESFKRPKGPVSPSEPVVIEIPSAKGAGKKKERGRSETKSTKKKEPPKVAENTKDQKQAEEAKPEIIGIPISQIPKEYPVNFDQRIGIFVDVQNMFYTAKHKYQRKIDFRKLIESISRKRKVIRAMAYIIEAPEIDQSQFKHVLEELGFELRIKELRVRADGTAKGDWDMGIAIDTISMRERLDVVALVSGDGDFTDLVYMLRSNGLRVEVYSFPSNTADDLKRAATYYFPLDEEVLMKW
jgi:uncharacterized LabA/DUF88 family protein